MSDTFRPRNEQGEDPGQAFLQAWKIIVIDEREEGHKRVRQAIEGLSRTSAVLEILPARDVETGRDLLTSNPDAVLLLLSRDLLQGTALGEMVAFVRLSQKNCHMRILVWGDSALDEGEELPLIRRFGMSEYRLRAELPVGRLRMRLAASLEEFSRLAGLTGNIAAASPVLAAAEKMRADFLTSTGHELRTPLTGMLTATDLLLQTGLAPDQKKLVQIQQGAASQLRLVLDRIIDYAMLQGGRSELRQVPFVPAVIGQECLQAFEEQAAARNTKLTFEANSRSKMRLMGDADRIRQIMFNLLSNAIRFSRGGLVHLQLTAWSGRDGNVIQRIEVQDEGPGIPETWQNRIYEPFFKGKIPPGSDDVESGTGLGLSVSYLLAAKMGGEISFENREQGGSRFWVLLPLQTAPDVPEKSRDEPGFDILLAEDNKVNARLISLMLKKAGHRVDVAEDGEKAVEAVKQRENGFDLILMDMQMPLMDGEEATAAIRALSGQAGETPIIALTAVSSEGIRDYYLSAGMNDYVVKPVEWESLQRTIMEHARLSR